MAPTVAVSGWLAAFVLCLSLVGARRALAWRVAAIARACHELRGPLTAARLGLELGVRRGALPQDRLRALDLELGRAALAIDDLALVAERGRIGAGPRADDAGSAGMAASRWEEVEIGGLIIDSVEAWLPFAEARGAAMSVHCAGRPVFVYGDRLRLAQATGNLIANAIEHGGGHVDVRVEAVGWAIRIEFIDDGPGLPAPVAEVARNGRRRRSPHGHGLAVAAAVAAGHGGRLAGAPSERGARVVLELPLHAAGRPVAGQVSAPDSPQPGGAGQPA